MPKTIAITPSWYWPESVDRITGIPPYGIHEICVLRHARDRPDQPALISDETITFGDLARKVTGSAPEDPGGHGNIELSGNLSSKNIIALLSGLARGQHITLGDNEGVGLVDADEHLEMVDLLAPAVSLRSAGGTVSHSHKSLLANAVSLATFLTPDPARAWLLCRPLSTWEGLLSLLLPLYLGAPVIVGSDADSEQFADAIVRHQPGYTLTELTRATRATREAKRSMRKARDVLNLVLLTTEGVFDPGDRERVGKALRCPALTAFGLAETGVIFAAHPQWYLDESIGIPITNAHVVPSDPRNGAPIQTLWELVESAEVTVKGPMLMKGYEDRNDTDYLVGGRFRTGVIASSDANGMIYLLPE